MMTSSNENIFRATGHLCGEFTGHRWIPRTEASDAELWCFLDLRPNERLSKQSWGWWFETPSRPLWRHCNVFLIYFAAEFCRDAYLSIQKLGYRGSMIWHALKPLFRGQILYSPDNEVTAEIMSAVSIAWLNDELEHRIVMNGNK